MGTRTVFAVLVILAMLIGGASQVVGAQVGAKAPSSPRYGVAVDLGGKWSKAFDLNNKGEAVGWSFNAANVKAGIIWDGKVVRRVEEAVSFSTINNRGLVAGVYFRPVPGYEWPVQRAFLFDRGAGEIIDLTASIKGMPADTSISWVTAMSNNAFCGECHIGGYGGSWYTFLSDSELNARVLPLSGVEGMNDHGVVVGSIDSYRVPALVDQDGSLRALPLPEASIAAKASASDINNRGQIIGNYRTNWSDLRSSHALYWAKSRGAWRVVELALPGYENSQANDINNRGQVVGKAIHRVPTSPNSAIVYETPFLWEDGRMVDLASITATGEWQLREAIAINDAGDIVCSAWNTRLKEEHCVILKRRGSR